MQSITICITESACGGSTKAGSSLECNFSTVQLAPLTQHSVAFWGSKKKHQCQKKTRTLPCFHWEDCNEHCLEWIFKIPIKHDSKFFAATVPNTTDSTEWGKTLNFCELTCFWNSYFPSTFLLKPTWRVDALTHRSHRKCEDQSHWEEHGVSKARVYK